MTMHWFLPGFLRALNRDDGHPARTLNLPHFRSALGKADALPCPDLWSACAAHLQLKKFPFAQISAACSHQSLDVPWALLTPMAIKPEHRGIYLLGEQALNLSRQERQQLQEELQAWMSEDGLRLVATGSEHWLLTLNQRCDLQTVPYWQVIGRDAMTVMPSGNDAMYWQAKMTEWQMILQRSFINQQRQQRHEKLVQGLHLWGESGAQLPHSTRLNAVYTDSDAIGAWLRQTASGITVRPLHEIRHNEFDYVLVMATQGESAWANGEFERWRDYWQNIDQLFAVRGHQKIYPDNGFSYSLQSLQRMKFWRGKSSLPAELQ